MLNNIKISQTLEEIVLTVNVVSDLPEILEELDTKLPKLKSFYKTSKLPMKITGKLFTENEMNKITEKITSEVEVLIKYDDPSDLLGLHAIKKTFETDTEISETKYIQNSIRSGQREEYSGSIVIMGDVNAGAEIIAGGNIAILGTLRGVAHAGANGNMKAIVSASSMDVTQVRIGNLVKEISEKIDKTPICEIEKGNIVIR